MRRSSADQFLLKSAFSDTCDSDLARRFPSACLPGQLCFDGSVVVLSTSSASFSPCRYSIIKRTFSYLCTYMLFMVRIFWQESCYVERPSSPLRSLTPLKRWGWLPCSFWKLLGSVQLKRWSDTCNGWLPIFVFIPDIKCGFLKENDAAEQVYCNKPVLPAWSLGADPCWRRVPKHTALLGKRLFV